MILLFGILFLAITGSFWKFGHTINAKAMIIPLFVISILHIGTGAAMIYNNTKRQDVYSNAFKTSPENFKQSEIQRTEGFIKLYPLTRYFTLAMMIIGFFLFVFLASPTWKSIGLCIMLLGFSVIIIDYFSEERAFQYHNELMLNK